jgi:hypothetical protein
MDECKHDLFYYDDALTIFCDNEDCAFEITLDDLALLISKQEKRIKELEELIQEVVENQSYTYKHKDRIYCAFCYHTEEKGHHSKCVVLRLKEALRDEVE